MKISIIALLLGVSVLLLTACLATSSQNASSQLQPALLKSISAQQKDELQAAASALLFGRKVSLGNNVFTQSHTVSIEQVAASDVKGRPIDGRLLSPENRVIVLSLWKNNTGCWLQREDNRQQQKLESINCSVL